MRDLSGWIEFFASAGVPPAVRKTYAQIFVDHRITDSVVADLEKDHLKDMGITVIGDIIAILKQCKKTGHEDPAASIPKVSSTTVNSELPKRKNSMSAQSTVVSSGNNITPRRCMTPEIEGKYIVKHPSGTTAKTRKILATLKQKGANDTRLAQPKISKRVEPDNGVFSASASFADCDTDDQMNYRVILSKNPAISTSSSVFERLGASLLSDESPSKKNTAAHRILQRSIDLSPEAKYVPQASTGRTLLSRPVARPGSRNENMARQPVRTVISDDSSSTVGRAQKRPATESVFSRLSNTSAAESQAFRRTSRTDKALDYHGVLKQARVSSQRTVRKPVQYPDSHKSISMKSSFPRKPLTYSEGVLGTAIKPIYWNESSVKSRLGYKNKGNQWTDRSTNVSSVHSRLGRDFNSM